MAFTASSRFAVALAVIGTALAFVVYYKIIEVAGATHLSVVTYILPVFGVILAALER